MQNLIYFFAKNEIVNKFDQHNFFISFFDQSIIAKNKIKHNQNLFQYTIQQDLSISYFPIGWVHTDLKC